LEPLNDSDEQNVSVFCGLLVLTYILDLIYFYNFIGFNLFLEQFLPIGSSNFNVLVDMISLDLLFPPPLFVF
jgi:hypothetical protein